MEYSVLAIFIYLAFTERFKEDKRFWKPALFALVLTLTVGVIDEGIQIFLPSRVFDPIDILFNSLAAFLAICASMILQGVRKIVVEMMKKAFEQH